MKARIPFLYSYCNRPVSPATLAPLYACETRQNPNSPRSVRPSPGDPDRQSETPVLIMSSRGTLSPVGCFKLVFATVRHSPQQHTDGEVLATKTCRDLLLFTLQGFCQTTPSFSRCPLVRAQRAKSVRH